MKLWHLFPGKTSNELVAENEEAGVIVRDFNAG